MVARNSTMSPCRCRSSSSPATVSRFAKDRRGSCVRELSASEGEMGNAAGRTCCLNLEALLQFPEIVPQALPASQNAAHDSDVHVFNKSGCQELTDRCRPSADSYTQAARRFPGSFPGLGGAGV